MKLENKKKKKRKDEATIIIPVFSEFQENCYLLEDFQDIHEQIDMNKPHACEYDSK